MKKSIFITLAVLFRILIDWIYQNEISALFGYSGYVNNSTSLSLCSSWICFFFFLPFILWTLEDNKMMLSQLISLFVFYFRVVPFTSVMRFIPQNFDFIILNILYWGLLLLLLRYLNPQNPLRIFKQYVVNDNVIVVITIVFVLTVLVVSGVYCHFRIHLNLNDVYDLRLEARQYNMPRVLSYLQSASSNIIPILITYYFVKDKKLIVLFLALIGLMNFSIAGHKSTLFKIIFCLALYLLPKINVRKILPYAFVLFCGLTVTEFVVLDSSVLSTMFIRRGFYTPPSLDISYYDYINMYGPTYFRGGIAHKIGILSGNEDMVCNNGMFSDAYMNLGTIGCFVFPFILAYFMKIVEYISSGLDDAIKLFSAFVIVVTLASSYFTTSLLTHGLFFLLITLYFYPKHNIEQ